jgi:hypothetical protein
VWKAPTLSVYNSQVVPAGRNIQITGLAAICWAMWKLRNKACFENKLTHSPFELISYVVVFMNYWAGLEGEKEVADIWAGEDNLMRLDSTRGNVETGNSGLDPALRLKDKKPDDDEEHCVRKSTGDPACLMVISTVFPLVLLLLCGLISVGDRFDMCCLVIVTPYNKATSLFRLLFVRR